MDVSRINQDTYAEVSDRVRKHCAERLGILLQDLTPYVNGSFGDIAAGHAAVYIAAVKELGRLYRVHEVPAKHAGEETLPLSAVEELVAVAVAETEARTAAAVEQRVRAELQLEHAAAVAASAAAARELVAGQVAKLRGR